MILPLANPPNPVLTARPPPLSAIVHPSRHLLGHTLAADEVATVQPAPKSGGLAGLGRRLSALVHRSPDETGVISNKAATADTHDIPSETGFPGSIDGKPLAAIVIPLSQLKPKLGGRENEGRHVVLPVSSAVAGKSGFIRFEFDREFLGGDA